MSPGGHLVTTAVACAVAGALGAPWETLAAVAAGGFLIDVDHAVDYVLFDGQRDLRPDAFLRYYLEGRVRRVVLVLHSYEVFALVAMLAAITDSTVLWAYLGGALMHLALDITFNGQLTPYSILAFYSFMYRWDRGFDAAALLGRRAVAPAPAGFWPAFFRGAELEAHDGGRPVSTLP